MDTSTDDEAKAKVFQMARSTEVKAARLIYAGPFPPPTHGQSLCTKVLAERLKSRGLSLTPIDLNASGINAVGRMMSKLVRHLRLVSAAWNAHAVYVSANSNAGMWLTAAVAGILRLAGKRLFIHHHAYDHIRRRRGSMVALARFAGPEATHVVLGRNMADQLMLHTPEVQKTLVLNNAGLVDETLLGLPIATSSICLGHLSNLSKEKGIVEVVDLAIRIVRSGIPARLLIAGPTTDPEARRAIDLAAKALGPAFEYLGAVSGEQKQAFFASISHFVFPTRYRNEASPMVLLEAMAAGVPCISTDIGCIRNDIGDQGGLVIAPSDDFVGVAEAWLSSEQDGEARARQARAQFMQLRREHDDQIGQLVALFEQADSESSPLPRSS